MAITPAEAQARLERMVAASAVPTLVAAEVTDLMAIAAVQDSAGLEPDEVGWEPTYDLNAAAATGWEWKAAKVAGAYDIGQDGSTLDRSQMHAQCMAMSKHYRGMIGELVGSLTRRGTRSGTIALTPAGASVGYNSDGLPELVLGDD